MQGAGLQLNNLKWSGDEAHPSLGGRALSTDKAANLIAAYEAEARAYEALKGPNEQLISVITQRSAIQNQLRTITDGGILDLKLRTIASYEATITALQTCIELKKQEAKQAAALRLALEAQS